MTSFIEGIRNDLLLFFDGRLKKDEHIKLFGLEQTGDVLPYRQRALTLGSLLDACSNEHAQSCWPKHLAIHYKLRVFHDYCYLLSINAQSPVPCEETLPEFGLPEVASACAGRSMCVPIQKTTFELLAEKCFPRTCAMRDFAKKAAQVSLIPKEAEKTIQVLACGMIGNFRHCGSTIRAVQRRNVLQRYYGPRGIEAFVEDVNSQKDVNQMFLFSIIREYLSVAVEQCPASIEHLRELYNWTEFTKIYREEMDFIRGKHDATTESLICSSNLPETTLARLKKTKNITPHSSPNRTLALKKQFSSEIHRALLIEHPNAFPNRKYFTSPQDARDWTRLLYSMPFGKRLSLELVANFLSPEGAKIFAAAGQAWINGSHVSLNRLSIQDAINIHNFLVVRAFNKNVRIIRLPDAIAHAQYAACSRRFVNQLHCEREQDRRTAARWASCVRLCAVCSSLRNYIETPLVLPMKRTSSDKAGKAGKTGEKPSKKHGRTKQGEGAIGFTGCVHSLDKGKISCKGSTAANERSAMCKESHLIQVELLTADEDEQPIGHVLLFGTQEYMLSPCCATLCARRDIVHLPVGWNCPTCRRSKIMHKEHLCDFCQRSFVRGGALVSATLKDDTGAWQEYKFCRTHARNYFTGEENAYKYEARGIFGGLQNF